MDITLDYDSFNPGSSPGRGAQQGGAEVACRAHNPKVLGSIPSPAIKINN